MRAVYASKFSSTKLREAFPTDPKDEELPAISCGCGGPHPRWEWASATIYTWCEKSWIARCLIRAMANELGDMKLDTIDLQERLPKEISPYEKGPWG